MSSSPFSVTLRPIQNGVGLVGCFWTRAARGDDSFGTMYLSLDQLPNDVARDPTILEWPRVFLTR